MVIEFTKMQSLGNDFMVVDAVTQNFFVTAETVKRLAHRKTGIGFDQLLIVEAPYAPDADFHYRIFNADGSEVGQCVNGARCLASFLHFKKLTYKRQIKVSTIKQTLMLHYQEDRSILVEMPAPIFEPKLIPFKAQKEEKNYLLSVLGQHLLASVVSVGNPHCIIQTEDLAAVNVPKLGAQIESHERFPEKTNVSWMQIIDRKHIKLRVFERGVGETQACGSAAAAAAAAAMRLNLVDDEVHVAFLAGDLTVCWKGDDSKLFLRGDAQWVFDGKIKL